MHLGSVVCMSDSPRKVSRQELYEMIWITPIVKLGKELGYSYLEMVQLCEKLNIPRPDGGYWYLVAQRHLCALEKTQVGQLELDEKLLPSP